MNGDQDLNNDLPPDDGQDLPDVVTVDDKPVPGRRLRHMPDLKPIPQPRRAGLFEDSEAAQISALTQALGTVFQRLDQQGKVLDTMYEAFNLQMQEFRDTTSLFQEAYNQVTDLVDKVARILAAQVKLYQIDAESNNDSLF